MVRPTASGTLSRRKKMPFPGLPGKGTKKRVAGGTALPSPTFPKRGKALHMRLDQNFALMLKNTWRGAPAINVWFQPCGSEAT